MAKEIERKYLVNKRKWSKVKSKVHTSETLVQGYLSKAPTHNVRVRISSNNYARLTIKGKAQGITRDEFEYKIPLEDAEQLIKMCDGSITKIRHWIQVGDHLWTIDEFKGINRGLLLAEVEFASEDEKFEMPEWVGEEVTYDKRYSNSYLSKHKVTT